MSISRVKCATAYVYDDNTLVAVMHLIFVCLLSYEQKLFLIYH